MGGPVTSKLDAVGRRLQTISAPIALDAAQAVADAITAQVRGDGEPRNVKTGGRVRVEARAVGTTQALTIPTSGAARLGIMQKGAKPHVIGQRRSVLAWQGSVVSGAVRHPGAAGKRTWSTGVTRGTPAARRAAAQRFRTVTSG